MKQPARGAIDLLSYVSTTEFAEKWSRAHQHEVSPLPERPHYFTVEDAAREMERCGVETACIAEARLWSYRQKWMLLDTQLEEVLQYTQRYPTRFIGLAGYNPSRIRESLQEIDDALRTYDFRGVYLHVHGFDIPLHDRKLYPLYGKCVEMDLPVIVRVGWVPEAMPSDNARPIYLDRVASDFPELKMVAALSAWTWAQELVCMCAKWPNLWMAIDGTSAPSMPVEVLEYIVGKDGRERCLWASNGMGWRSCLESIAQLGLPEELGSKLLRENAISLLKLAGAEEKACTADASEAMIAER